MFLGVLIGCIFLIGTLLITYYKQVSEGFEDRQKYQIMKKVGLPDKLIKQTASNQIVWMFFIPLSFRVRAHREWAESFNAWLARKNPGRAGADPSWPLAKELLALR